MRKIPTKNYIILLVLLIVTIILTLGIFEIYKKKTKKVSNLYDFLNKITINEISSFTMENPESLIYISNKYNVKYNKFEQVLSKKINSINLYDRSVYIDTSSITLDEQTKLKNKYIEYSECEGNPLLLILQDKNVIQSICVSDTTIIDDINYEVFKW